MGKADKTIFKLRPFTPVDSAKPDSIAIRGGLWAESMRQGTNSFPGSDPPYVRGFSGAAEPKVFGSESDVEAENTS
jgi:hypothetical protein